MGHHNVLSLRRPALQMAPLRSPLEKERRREREEGEGESPFGSKLSPKNAPSIKVCLLHDSWRSHGEKNGSIEFKVKLRSFFSLGNVVRFCQGRQMVYIWGSQMYSDCTGLLSLSMQHLLASEM